MIYLIDTTGVEGINRRVRLATKSQAQALHLYTYLVMEFGVTGHVRDISREKYDAIVNERDAATEAMNTYIMDCFREYLVAHDINVNRNPITGRRDEDLPETYGDEMKNHLTDFLGIQL